MEAAKPGPRVAGFVMKALISEDQSPSRTQNMTGVMYSAFPENVLKIRSQLFELFDGEQPGRR